MNPRSADPMKIDGIELSELIASIVWNATYHRDLARAYRVKAGAAWAEHDMVAGLAYTQAAGRERYHMLVSVRPLRKSIGARTRLEEATAKRLADCGAVFRDPDTSPGDCLDCERPGWQHIWIPPTAMNLRPRSLCPFGREYWALARILNGPEYRGKSILREIARRRA